jgi:hypothetical protein
VGLNGRGATEGLVEVGQDGATEGLMGVGLEMRGAPKTPESLAPIFRAVHTGGEVRVWAARVTLVA